MINELCTTYDSGHSENKIKNVQDLWRRLGRVAILTDTALDWVTERLDRKFLSAMERSTYETPDRKREMKLLKRTVLILVCLGLAVTVITIKLSAEAQIVYAVLG